MRLAQMNARRNIEAKQSARNYVRNNTDFNGKIRNPILTMHTIIDPLLVVANESAYAELNASAGKEDLLFQTYTTGVGHCNFTGPQVLTAIGAIDSLGAHRRASDKRTVPERPGLQSGLCATGVLIL